MSNDSKDLVYGIIYENAETQMKLIQEAIIQQEGKGFESSDACEQWANDFKLDIIAYSKISKSFLSVSHKGILLTKHAWLDCYGHILFYKIENEKGQVRKYKWFPEGHKYFDNAKIPAEISDGLHKPLYHRDYFTPTGYFDESTQTFNVAKPSTVFAKETGRDTSHIYTYIEHVAGECSMWLLAWLRAKLVNPKEKTQIVPIIVSRTQGTGKSTFAEVICKGLFGKDNVIVTDQYDSQARFNADYADALVVCQEEKEETDRKNPAATIKSRATATQIRKEYKGLDPIYQDSYTEFMMTTNKDVPIKFDDSGDQRRFMIMEADSNFTRKTSELADEVFTKLYGIDSNMQKKGIPFKDDKELIQQFKHELFSREDIKKVELRKFPKTAAYHRCYTLPRTTENTEIDSIIKSIAPFIKAMLEAKAHVDSVDIVNDCNETEVLLLSDIIIQKEAIQYFSHLGCVAVCRPLVFTDQMTSKPYSHSIVERALLEADKWLDYEFGIRLLPDMRPVAGGFYGLSGRFRNSPAARFCLSKDYDLVVGGQVYTQNTYKPLEFIEKEIPKRIGKCLRVNKFWKVDELGEFETVNEMKPDINSLENKNNNVQYLDTFLLESDIVPKSIELIEEDRIKKWLQTRPRAQIEASTLFAERLNLQQKEADRLYKEGIVRRVVYSGAKSIHLLVRVKDMPDNLEQYKWLHSYLASTLSDILNFDMSTADPARLTRAPITSERFTEFFGVRVHGTQMLQHENEQAIYDVNWRPLYRQWLSRPLEPIEKLNGKRLIPTKQEYKDAASALLSGTFWTDNKFNGNRQHLFFPAYRLCRFLGFSHSQLWNDNGILDGLESYYRQNEISYWKSRETCSLIQQIDRLFDVEDSNE